MSIFERGTSSGHYSFMSLIQDVKNVYVKKNDSVNVQDRGMDFYQCL